MAGSVEVATAGVLRAWRRAEYGELWLQFEPRGPADFTQPIAAAITVANGAFDANDIERDFVEGEGPWLVPVGPPAYQLLLTYAGHEHSIVRWLDTFADHLASAGLTGRVTAMPIPDYPSLSMVETILKPQMRAFLAFRMVDLSPPRQVPYRWNVDAGTTDQIASIVEDRAFPGAETYFGSGRTIRTGPAASAAALRRCAACHTTASPT